MTDTRPVRVPARMAEYLHTSQAGSTHAAGRAPHPDDVVTATVLDALAATPARKDGSRVLRLTAEQAADLTEHAGYLAAAAADDAGQDPDARADLNAARATMRWCAAAVRP